MRQRSVVVLGVINFLFVLDVLYGLPVIISGDQNQGGGSTGQNDCDDLFLVNDCDGTTQPTKPPPPTSTRTRTTTNPPGPVSGLSVSAGNCDDDRCTFTISWSDSQDDVDSYQVYRVGDPNALPLRSVFPSISESTGSWSTSVKAACGTTQTFRVIVLGNGKKSTGKTASASGSCSVAPPPTKPSTPTLKAPGSPSNVNVGSRNCDNENCTYVVTWDGTADGIAKFQVYIVEGSSQSKVKELTPLTGQTSWGITHRASCGTSHTFGVKAHGDGTRYKATWSNGVNASSSGNCKNSPVTETPSTGGGGGTTTTTTTTSVKVGSFKFEFHTLSKVNALSQGEFKGANPRMSVLGLESD